MEFQFHMQDPTDPSTRYLYEAIIGAAERATSWRGMYAFATRNGVNQLIEDPVTQTFIDKGGSVDLVVGIDAITNLQTLQRLQELAQQHAQFRPKVFWNATRGLFHPKISQFSYADGSKTLIVGSGNLTPGGLMHNFEAYSVVNSGPREQLDLVSFDAFLARHAADIRPIDQDALDRAALNVARPVAGVPRLRAPGAPRVAPRVAVPAAVAAPLDRVLIAQVPRAGGRWSQVHFNKDIIDRFFRITDLAIQRVYLTRVDTAGVRGEEEIRPCIYSASNKNYKIEIAAAKGHEYPAVGVPVLVFRERQVRVFDYMLVMPGEAGHAALINLTDSLPSVGKGHRRAITDMAVLSRGWPRNPIEVAAQAEAMEL